MYDIVYYNKENEKEFIELALQLKYNGLVFIHTLKNFVEVKSKKLDIINIILCSAKDVPKARKITHFVLTPSTANDKANTDRHTMEKVKPDGMLLFEKSSRRDFMHHRNSSLNHILAKIMHDKKIAYIVDYSMIFSNIQQTLGRVEQNLMLAKKYKVNIILGSFAKKPLDMCSWKDMISFFSFLNLSPKDCKQAFNNLKKIYDNNSFKKTDKYIADGVSRV